MNAGNALVILQTICLTASVCMILMLLFSRFQQSRQTNEYETSRWLLIVGISFFAVHYWAQIHFGFRAMGDDVGALINILFYTPAVYVIAYSMLSFCTGRRFLRRYATIAGASMLIQIALFCMGWFTYKSLHMQHALYSMALVFLLTILYYVISTWKKIRRVRRQVENDTANDIETYTLFMRTGTILLFCLTPLFPIAIFSKYALGAIGPVLLVALLFYVMCFIAFGYRLVVISEVLDETLDADEDEEQSREVLSEAMVKNIQERLKTWIANKGFNDADVNISALSRQIKVSKSLLTQYFQMQEVRTFRAWLSAIRIEEAKHLLLEHESYSIEAIARECGFSSRTWMQQRFKAVTGMTPTEWREKGA